MPKPESNVLVFKGFNVVINVSSCKGNPFFYTIVKIVKKKFSWAREEGLACGISVYYGRIYNIVELEDDM